MDTFLLYVLRLESEASEGFSRLAGMMEPESREVTQLFARLANYSRQHLEEIEEFTFQRLGGIPDYMACELEWPDGASPENPFATYAGGRLDMHEALALGLAAELRASDFYRMVAGASPDPAVRDMAQDQSEEEAVHAELIERWIRSYREGH